MNTFNSFCIGACVFMIFVGMSFGFITAIGAFPTSYTGSVNATGTDLTILENLTGNVTGQEGHLSWGAMWGIATGGAIAVSVVFAILTHSTNMIGVWLFGTFFWSSYASIIGMLFTFDFLSSGAGLILATMITIGMTIMFVGAVIGMLSGSHYMR